MSLHAGRRQIKVIPQGACRVPASCDTYGGALLGQGNSTENARINSLPGQAITLTPVRKNSMSVPRLPMRIR